MLAAKNDIISNLRKDVLRLQGFKECVQSNRPDTGLGSILNSFPNSTFPTACIHEFISDRIENTASTSAFVTVLLKTLVGESGASLWISSSRTIFPPALKHYGINPDRFIFVDVQNERDALWAMDEGLKCEAVSTVVAELKDVSFTNSRRWQLAVEKSQVTGFILRKNSCRLNTTAFVSRWKISSLPGEPVQNLPGLGFPRWRVELLKVKNGKTGSWHVTWKENCFHIEQQTLKAQSIEDDFQFSGSIKKAG